MTGGAYLYILLCADGSYYTGTARSGLEQRLAQHNAGTYGGYKAQRRPVALVFSQWFERITDAIEAGTTGQGLVAREKGSSNSRRFRTASGALKTAATTSFESLLRRGPMNCGVFPTLSHPTRSHPPLILRARLVRRSAKSHLRARVSKERGGPDLGGPLLRDAPQRVSTCVGAACARIALRCSSARGPRNAGVMPQHVPRRLTDPYRDRRRSVTSAFA
jgi:putative endonuclease